MPKPPRKSQMANTPPQPAPDEDAPMVEGPQYGKQRGQEQGEYPFHLDVTGGTTADPVSPGVDA